MSVGANIAKPVTIALFIVAAPVAIALLKILQALEFLLFINIENLPTNVQSILSMVGAGNIFSGMLGPLDFYKFDEGKANEKTEESSSEADQNFDSGSSGSTTLRLLDERERNNIEKKELDEYDDELSQHLRNNRIL